MRVGPFAFCLIVYPLSFIDVTIGMYQLALAICFIVSPLSIVTRAIRPELCSLAIAHTVEPLACVNCAIFKRERTLCYASILVYLFGWVLLIFFT